MVLTAIDVKLIGQWLLGNELLSCLSSCLKTGTTLAQTQSLSIVPVATH